MPWVTLIVTPPTVKVPVRTELPELAAIRTVARPLPDPFGVSTVIHGVVVAAVQLQPVPVAIVTETWPPLKDADTAVGFTVTPQEFAACETEKNRPAIMSEPVRVNEPAFGLTV